MAEPLNLFMKVAKIHQTTPQAVIRTLPDVQVKGYMDSFIHYLRRGVDEYRMPLTAQDHDEIMQLIALMSNELQDRSVQTELEQLVDHLTALVIRTQIQIDMGRQADLVIPVPHIHNGWCGHQDEAFMAKVKAEIEERDLTQYLEKQMVFLASRDTTTNAFKVFVFFDREWMICENCREEIVRTPEQDLAIAGYVSYQCTNKSCGLRWDLNTGKAP